MKKSPESYLIQSVSHAINVMEALAASKQEMGVTELAKSLGLHKNNIFRILATLSLKGLVQQNPITENYSLGPAALRMGQAYLLNSDLVNRVRPYLIKLHGRLDETICFVKLIGQDTHYPITISSTHPVTVAPRHGKVMPAKTTLAGQLLSEKDPKNDYKMDNSGIEKDVAASCMLVRGLGNSILGAVEILEPAFRANLSKSKECLEQAVSEINACFAIDSQKARGEKLADKVTKEITKAETDILTTDDSIVASAAEVDSAA